MSREEAVVGDPRDRVSPTLPDRAFSCFRERDRTQSIKGLHLTKANISLGALAQPALGIAFRQ